MALLLPNSPQAVIAQVGAWKAGAIVSPLNALYTDRELEHALNETGAETVVVLTPFYAKIKALQPRTAIKRVIATNIKEYLPPVVRLLFTVDKEKKEGHRVTLQPGDLWLGDLIKQHASGKPNVVVGPQDPALLLFSGGTTGLPKAALGTHQAIMMAALQLHAYAQAVLEDWNGYYGLFGDLIFQDFESRFLKKNIQGELFASLFNPVNVARLLSPDFDRSDLAGEYYDKYIFDGGTIGDIAKQKGPMIIIIATDMTYGVRIVLFPGHV